jgi:hypothetical protein
MSIFLCSHFVLKCQEEFLRSPPPGTRARSEKAPAAGDPTTALFYLFNRPSKTFEQELTPTDGPWPPGYDVNDCRTIAVGSAAPAAEGIADTALGRLLRAKGAL